LRPEGFKGAEVAILSAVAVITRAANSHWPTLRHLLPPSLPRQVGDDFCPGPASAGRPTSRSPASSTPRTPGEFQ
jgi:hypothetical protein